MDIIYLFFTIGGTFLSGAIFIVELYKFKSFVWIVLPLILCGTFFLLQSYNSPIKFFSYYLGSLIIFSFYMYKKIKHWV